MQDIEALGVRTCAVDRAPLDAEALFQRTFKHPAPDFGHHVCAASDTGLFCYIHFWELDGALMGGGACIDQHALRRMSPESRQYLRAAGGAYQCTLRWAIAHFSGRFEAIFGYCGNPLAERADLAAGFERTALPRVLAYWYAPGTSADRSALLERVGRVGPF
jgi:hypothetical protein